MEPDSSRRTQLKVLLMIAGATFILLVAGFIYWAATGDPVEAPQAPTGEATIPAT